MNPDPYQDAPEWWLQLGRELADVDPGPLPEPGYSTDEAGTFTGDEDE